MTTSSTGISFIPLTIIIIFGILITSGLIVLEVFLAKKANKFLGLIPPIITFIISLPVIIISLIGTPITLGSVFLGIIPLILLVNINTIILFIIYACLRSNKKKQKQDELKKMNIQDL